MSDELIEDNDGMKIRKLVELKTSTAKEYEEIMLDRVKEFKNKNAEKSVFNNLVQNTLVSTFGVLLDLKVKVDEVIGEENLKKIHDILDSALLIGL
ncbi:MAG: hypothetical protein ACW96S_07920 [Promethearchaeota archaeon]|jgi:hypothetical protein